MDPEAVRGLALVLRTQADLAEEAAARINSALVLAGLTSAVPGELVGRGENWRSSAGVLDTRATLAESFRVDLIAAPSVPVTAAPTRTFSVSEREFLGAAISDLLNMTEEERAAAVAEMSDEELAAVVDYATFTGQRHTLLALLLPVVDPARTDSWSEGLPGVDSIADLNDRIENWAGSDNDPMLDALIAERRALVEALTTDEKTWNYDTDVAAFAEMYALDYDQAALILDANRIASLTVQIDGLAGMPGPVLDAMMAERQALIDSWLEADEFPPEIAAVVLPLLSIPEIVDVERRHPNTVSIARLNAILVEHDAAWRIPQPIDPEIEELRALRDALVADLAGQDAHLGLDPEIAAIAQVNSISYVEAEALLILGQIGDLNRSIAAVGPGPVANAMIEERNALLARVSESDAETASVMGGLLDDGFPIEDVVMVSAAAGANDLGIAEIAALARSEGLSLLDAANMSMAAAVYAMTPDELMAFEGFKQHFDVIDNATGGETDGSVSMRDLQHVVDHPDEFDVEVVAAATALLSQPGLQYRLDTGVENGNVVNAEGRFGGTRADDGHFTLDDLEMFEVKQNISFLVGENYDDIDIAHEGGETDGFLSKHDFEDFLAEHRGDLTEQEIWALETVIAAEFYDKAWLERNKHALALAAAVVAGAVFVIATGGLGAGLTGALITVVAAGGVGATAAAQTTLAINLVSSESDWDDDLVTNAAEGFIAGAGSGGAVLGVQGFAALSTAQQIATGLGLVSDVSGLTGMGAFDLGLQYAVHQEDLDDVHDFADTVSLVTGVPAVVGGVGAVSRPIRARLGTRAADVIVDAADGSATVREFMEFTTHGLSDDAAMAFLETPAGQRLFDTALEAAPLGTSLDDVERRVVGWLRSGADVPELVTVTEPLVKIVPKGVVPESYSPFFTTQAELDRALREGVDLSDFFGLPAGSTAYVYDVYRIAPGPEAVAIRSSVAPTTEFAGALTTNGGAVQYIVPNRELFEGAELVDTVVNPGPSLEFVGLAAPAAADAAAAAASAPEINVFEAAPMPAGIVGP